MFYLKEKVVRKIALFKDLNFIFEFDTQDSSILKTITIPSVGKLIPSFNRLIENMYNGFTLPPGQESHGIQIGLPFINSTGRHSGITILPEEKIPNDYFLLSDTPPGTVLWASISNGRFPMMSLSGGLIGHDLVSHTLAYLESKEYQDSYRALSGVIMDKGGYDYLKENYLFGKVHYFNENLTIIYREALKDFFSGFDSEFTESFFEGVDTKLHSELKNMLLKWFQKNIYAFDSNSIGMSIFDFYNDSQESEELVKFIDQIHNNFPGRVIQDLGGISNEVNRISPFMGIRKLFHSNLSFEELVTILVNLSIMSKYSINDYLQWTLKHEASRNDPYYTLCEELSYGTNTKSNGFYDVFNMDKLCGEITDFYKEK